MITASHSALISNKPELLISMTLESAASVMSDSENAVTSSFEIPERVACALRYACNSWTGVIVSCRDVVVVLRLFEAVVAVTASCSFTDGALTIATGMTRESSLMSGRVYVCSLCLDPISAFEGVCGRVQKTGLPIQSLKKKDNVTCFLSKRKYRQRGEYNDTLHTDNSKHDILSYRLSVHQTRIHQLVQSITLPARPHPRTPVVTGLDWTVGQGSAQ